MKPMFSLESILVDNMVSSLVICSIDSGLVHGFAYCLRGYLTLGALWWCDMRSTWGPCAVCVPDLTFQPSCMCQCAFARKLGLAHHVSYNVMHVCHLSLVQSADGAWCPVIRHWEEIVPDMLSQQVPVKKCSRAAFKRIGAKQEGGPSENHRHVYHGPQLKFKLQNPNLP